MGDAEWRALGRGAQRAKRVMGDVGAALHVVDAGTERAVAFDLERQALDESQGMNGIEVAQHQDAGPVLAPGRACQQMIAAAVDAGDALERDRQIAIMIRDQRHQPVDLFRRLCRRLDLHPAPDAVENSLVIKPVGVRHGRIYAFESHHPGGRASKRGRK
ncbi:hypothetical protein ABIE79_007016 [Bradyrhizobium diazoefficiens]